MREGDSEEPKPNCLKKSNGSCRSCRAFASKPASPCISYFRRFSSSESTCRRVYRARACGRAGRSPNLIRIGYRRKLLCGACVAVLVRMILQRHLAIRLLQLRRIRIPGHAKFLQSECWCTAQLRERNADLVVVARSLGADEVRDEDHAPAQDPRAAHPPRARLSGQPCRPGLFTRDGLRLTLDGGDLGQRS